MRKRRECKPLYHSADYSDDWDLGLLCTGGKSEVIYFGFGGSTIFLGFSISFVSPLFSFSSTLEFRQVVGEI